MIGIKMVALVVSRTGAQATSLASAAMLIAIWREDCRLGNESL